MRIVFDIGGTSFRYAKYEDGLLVASAKGETPNYLQGYTPDEISRLLLERIAEAIGTDAGKVTEVGICYAGPVSGEGRILASPTIHGVPLERPFDLKADVQKLIGTPDVWVINDLSAAAFRYIEDFSAFELVSISTSVGSKIVVEGQLQLGPEGFEGELGHALACLPTPYADELSIECSCGCGVNHIGAISSGRGIAEVASLLAAGSLKESFALSPLRESFTPQALEDAESFKVIRSLTTESITAACEQGDVFSRQVIDICTYPLAHALCLTLTSLYLEKVVLMGGVVLNSPYYVESLVNNVLNIGVYNYTEEHLRQKIIKGIFDDDNGLVGMNKYLDIKLQR